MTEQITTWDDQDIIDLVVDTMSDANDMDVRFSDFAKAVVTALREKDLLPSIEGARAILQAECDKLTAAAVAKGCQYDQGQIWIGYGRLGFIVRFDHQHDKPMTAGLSGNSWGWGCGSLSEAIEQAAAAIAAAPDESAYSSDFTGPLVLRAEHAQAAE